MRNVITIICYQKVMTERRDVLKNLATGALGGIAVGMPTGYHLKDNRTTDQPYPREIVGSHQILEEYVSRLEALTEPEPIDTSLSLAIGERHRPYGDSFATLKTIIDEQNPSKLGMEFLYENDSVLESFNENDISYEQITNHYLEVGGGWNRDREQVKEAFKSAEENEVEIIGLEFQKGAHYPEVSRRERRPSVESFLERSEKMVDIAERENNEDIVYLTGSAHTERDMAVIRGLLNSANPEISNQLTPEDVVADPYIYEEFDLENPADPDTSAHIDLRALYIFPRRYKIAGRMEKVTPVLSTHPDSQRNLLQSTLNDLERTNIQEYELIQDIVDEAEEEFERMEKLTRRGSYTAESKSGYPIVMEPNL